MHGRARGGATYPPPIFPIISGLESDPDFPFGSKIDFDDRMKKRVYDVIIA